MVYTMRSSHTGAKRCVHVVSRRAVLKDAELNFIRTRQDCREERMWQQHDWDGGGGRSRVDTRQVENVRVRVCLRRRCGLGTKHAAKHTNQPTRSQPAIHPSNQQPTNNQRSA